MHTTVKAIYFGVATVALAAAGLHIAEARATAAEVIDLGRVDVYVKHGQPSDAVVELPRVVVVARRQARAAANPV